MFETQIGPVKDAGSTVYLRPETAQGIFLDFKTTLQYARKKPPFGIAQVGKSFRNEITPGNFVFRTLEFEQMEMEFFVPPAEAAKWHEHWMEQRMEWYVALGIDREELRLRPHGADELSHYSSATSDIEYLYPIGWSELEGIANRGDFDLTQHAEYSGQKLEYVDTASGDRYVPHVIEPAGGVGRTVLALLCDAYDEDDIGGEQRTVLRLKPQMAPIKVAVLPLVNKDGQPEKARAIYEELRGRYPRRVRHRRLDRQALPPPGRDRHALGGHGRPPDDGGRHRDPARPRHARAGADRGERAGRRDRAPARRAAAARSRRAAARGRALRQPPVPLAHQLHRRRHEHEPDERRVERDRHRQAHADLLDRRHAGAGEDARTPRP